jgi:GDP-L-fucose synthase
MVGSAIVRTLLASGVPAKDILTRTHAELDLRNQAAVQDFFQQQRPTQVYLAAAKVGGIHANNTYPANFIYDNLMMQANVIDAAHRAGVQKLLFLGSSCIYPRLAVQPMAEDALLTGPLEPTNEPYAIAKIAGIKLCESYNRQYGASHGIDYRSVMPTNLYGPGDNYHPENSHVIPGLIRKFHQAKLRGDATVPVWGSGTPRREFLYSDEMAEACVFLINLPDDRYDALLGSDEVATGRFDPPLINVGKGDDVTIRELAEEVRAVVGFKGEIVFDASKPDGTPRKLMDVSRLKQAGWQAKIELRQGLQLAYADFQRHAGH